MDNKSFSVIRTTPSLTGNIKIVFTTNDLIYLESFDSDKNLSNIKFKHKLINPNNYLSDIIPQFFDGLPNDIIFSVKNNNDGHIMYENYSDQFDDIYFQGNSYTEDNFYTEEYEYLSPLHISKFHLPKWFIVLRVDGNGKLELTKDNFRNEVLNNWKSVKLFDMRENTNRGSFLINNLIDTSFPYYSLDINWRKFGFSEFKGINTEDSGWKTSSMFLEDYLFKNELYYEFEKFIIENYKNKGIIYPFLVNLKFLFDDTPATPTNINKWTLNRYYGFYLNELNLLNNSTPYIPNYEWNIRKDGKIIQLLNNTFVISNGFKIDDLGNEIEIFENVDPIKGGFEIGKNYFVWYGNDNLKFNFYTIKKFIENGIDIYKLISNINLPKIQNIYESFNNKLLTAKIVYTTNSTSNISRNYIKLYNKQNDRYDLFISSDINKSINETDGGYYYSALTGIDNDIIVDLNIYNSGKIPNFLNDASTKNKAIIWEEINNYDLLILKIYENNYTIQKDEFGFLYINSDGKFTQNSTELIYEINLNGIIEAEERLLEIEIELNNLVNTDSEFINNYNKALIRLNDEKLRLMNNINNWRTKIKINELNGFDLPLKLEIYGAEFTDIKDFDFDRKETKYTDYEYQTEKELDDSSVLSPFFTKDRQISNTTPPIRVESNNQRLNRLNIYGNEINLNKLNQKIIPVSSEYITSEESFIINQNELNSLWNKNQSTPKWGLIGSLNINDYPHRLNNTSINGSYDLGPNPFEREPNIKDRNLEWFYINYPSYGELQTKILKNSLHIENKINLINKKIGNENYDWGYINAPYDYFSYFFNSKQFFKNWNDIGLIENSEKWSVFNIINGYVPTQTSFKKMFIEVADLETAIINDNQPFDNIVLKPNLNFNGYKFSILFTIEPLDELIENWIPAEILTDKNKLINYTSNPNFILPPIPEHLSNKIDYDIFINHKYKNILIVLRIYKHPIEDVKFNILNIPEKNDLTIENNFIFNLYETGIIYSKSKEQKYLIKDGIRYWIWKDNVGNQILDEYWIKDNVKIIKEGLEPDLYEVPILDINNLTLSSFIETINSQGSNLNENSKFRYWVIDDDINLYDKDLLFNKQTLLINDDKFKFRPMDFNNEIYFENDTSKSVLPHLLIINYPDVFPFYEKSFNLISNNNINNIVLTPENTLNTNIIIDYDVNGIPNYPINVDYYWGESISLTLIKKPNLNKVDNNKVLDKRLTDWFEMSRYSGIYSPIFNDISLFRKGNLNDIKFNPFNLNYKFDTNLTNFGLSSEIIINKVNEDKKGLYFQKVLNKKPIYPRIDEWGLSVIRHFIFKSDYDYNYYKKFISKK